MAGELNTEVEGDPAACRATADWLGTLSTAVYDAESAVRNGVVASLSCWEGPASDAFRAAMGPLADDAGELSRIVDRVQAGLNTFAGELETVIARMHQARRVAFVGGLVVTMEAILPPGPGPGPAPSHPVGPMYPAAERAFAAEQAAYGAAAAAHAEKVAAFNEVVITVAEARLREAAAHEALAGVTAQQAESAVSLRTIGQTALTAGLLTVQGLHDEAGDLIRQADRSASTAGGCRTSPRRPRVPRRCAPRPAGRVTWRLPARRSPGPRPTGCSGPSTSSRNGAAGSSPLARAAICHPAAADVASCAA